MARRAAAATVFDEAVDLESVKKLTLTLALFITDWCGLEPV